MEDAKILVVEDDAVVAKDICGSLENLGYSVPALVSSGEDAVAKAGELRPDLVLMDIRLKKGMDGIEAAERIRGSCNIPIVYLTAYSDDDTLRRAKATQPYGYILKPFEERELHTIIEIALFKHGMEARLKESQERYMLASMAVHDGLWDWNLATGKIYFSPTWKALLGFMDDEIKGDPEEWFRRLHPDDEERVREGIAKLRGGFLSRFEGEYRIRHKDGSYRWMLCRGISAGGSNGKTRRLCGSQHDVTKRKQTEESMRLVEESMRHLVSTTAEGMVVVGGDGAVLFSNRAAQALLERKAETMDGKPFEFDVEPDMKKKVEIIRGKEVVAIVELRTAGVRWEGRDALLVTVRDITDFVRMQEEISALALLDELTSLYNRRAFIMMAQQQLNLAERAARDMFLLFIDVDNLKGINDSHGHQKGDMALIETAKILKSTFRRSDIIARVGGDEFIVLAVEAHRGSGELLLGRLQQAVDALNDRADRPYELSLSIGAARYDPAAPSNIDDLMAQADKAMYENKRERKSQP